MAAASTYAPVAGVSFDVLCAVMADVTRVQMQRGQPPTAQADERTIDPYAAAAGGRGIAPTDWMRAQLVWGCRAMLDPDIAIEQGQAIGRLLTPNMPDLGALGSFGMAAMQAPAPPLVDPADPRLAPIEGVTIETYVRLIATQVLYRDITPGQLHEVAVNQLGMPADRWPAISAQWGDRVVGGPPVSVRYADLVCQLLS